MTSQYLSDKQVLHLNVGFLLKEGVGSTRTFAFDKERLVAQDVELHHLQGKLSLTRTTQGILLQGRLDAETVAECVRCLSETLAPVELELSEHFIYPPWTAKDGELTVSEGGLIDLTPLVREDTILAIPMHVLCQPQCRGLCSQCGQNLNEGQCDCDHSAIDPRFAVLKSLLDD